MAGILASRRALKDRSRILRGVYEENLAMSRKTPSSRVRRKRIILRKVVAAAIAGISLLALYGVDLGWTPQESHVVESSLVATDEIFVTASPVESVNNADVTALEKGSGIPLSRMLGLGIQRIVIDAGHGGEDEGAIGKAGALEKDITLDIATHLQALLNSQGYSNVLMTRTDDIAVPLAERVAFAQRNEADLFLSIHVNWLPNTPVNLVETFYFGPSSDERILKLAGHENRGSDYGLNDFREIVERLGIMMKLQESKEFAESVQECLYAGSSRSNPKLRDNGVKRAPFAVLIGLEVPSVLAEVSCLSNPAEEVRLKSGAHRRKIAEYLAEGVTNYLKMGVGDDRE